LNPNARQRALRNIAQWHNSDIAPTRSGERLPHRPPIEIEAEAFALPAQRRARAVLL
jgi:hypothetical protein